MQLCALLPACLAPLPAAAAPLPSMVLEVACAECVEKVEGRASKRVSSQAEQASDCHASTMDYPALSQFLPNPHPPAPRRASEVRTQPGPLSCAPMPDAAAAAAGLTRCAARAFHNSPPCLPPAAACCQPCAAARRRLGPCAAPLRPQQVFVSARHYNTRPVKRSVLSRPRAAASGAGRWCWCWHRPGLPPQG